MNYRAVYPKALFKSIKAAIMQSSQSTSRSVEIAVTLLKGPST